MRNLTLILAALFTLALGACGGSDEPAAPKPALLLRSHSVQQGASIAASTSTVTVSYNNLIALSGSVTLNGSPVQARAAGMDLEISVSLEPWKEYELLVPAGAVTLKEDGSVKAPECRIKFDTKVGRDPNAPSTLAQAPVNPKASPEAKALYSLLLEGYGKRMLTGAMGGVAWETTYTDFLNAKTGSYPAVVGFDYIHMPYSPANWIDYSNLDPVRSITARGCIVQIQWHWSVPKRQGATEYGFYKDDTSFNPANILVDGTWEHEVAEADVARLAGYLDLLQQEGIPVLWRPFHEAAGDYRWGAWFWWGTKGVEVTRQLYRWMYDKLTNTYGLNNLIWVWTVQTSNEGRMASLEQVRAAYPGDDVVDIVGADIYPQAELTTQTPIFRMVEDCAEGHKMVALTECGNLLDPDKSLADGALWCYFMQWCDMQNGTPGFFNYGGPDQWNRLLASPAVEGR